MKKKILILLVVFGVIYGVSHIYKDDSQIGVIAPLTGIAPSYGEDIRDGVNEEIQSGVLYEDDACEPIKAISAFNKLTKINNVNVVIGPGCGSPQEAVAPLLKDSNSIMLVPSAASSELFTISNGNFFNMQYSLEDESKFLAQEMERRNFKKVALISYKNNFSQTLAKGFRENFKSGSIVEISFVNGDSDISTEISKLKNQGIDAMMVTDITFFFQQGIKKLKEFTITAPVFSSYVTELPAVRSLVEAVLYAYPGDLSGDRGATYEISKQAAGLVRSAKDQCGNNISCIKKYFVQSDKFDSNGVYKRTIVLKRIQDGQAISVK